MTSISPALFISRAKTISVCPSNSWQFIEANSYIRNWLLLVATERWLSLSPTKLKSKISSLYPTNYKTIYVSVRPVSGFSAYSVQAGTVRWQSRMETQGIGLIFKFQVSILVLNFQRIFTNNFEEGIVSWKCNRSDDITQWLTLTVPHTR